MIRLSKEQKGILCNIIANNGRLAAIRALRFARPKVKGIDLIRYIRSQAIYDHAYEEYKIRSVVYTN